MALLLISYKYVKWECINKKYSATKYGYQDPGRGIIKVPPGMFLTITSLNCVLLHIITNLTFENNKQMNFFCKKNTHKEKDISRTADKSHEYSIPTSFRQADKFVFSAMIVLKVDVTDFFFLFVSGVRSILGRRLHIPSFWNC